MKFKSRLELNESIESALNSADAEVRCIAHNCVIEENVSDNRLRQVERIGTRSTDDRAVLMTYNDEHVKVERGAKVSSTFKDVNDMALLSVNPDPRIKIIRIEEVSDQVPDETTYKNLIKAIEGDRSEQNVETLENFMENAFNGFDGRPSFAAYKSDLSSDLRKKDWPQVVIDRLGLYNHYRASYRDSGIHRTLTFALMEYTVGEVVRQANIHGVKRCFAVPTILESPDNPAFFPVPNNSDHGYCVDLAGQNPLRPIVREIIHFPFEYSINYLKFLKSWFFEKFPNCEKARGLHKIALQIKTGSMNFGDLKSGGRHD